MKGSSKGFCLNARQSTNLLRLGLDPDNDRTDRATARSDLLLDTLASKVPVDPALLESLPVVLRSLSDQLQSLSGLPVGDLLLSPQTKIAAIRRIKDFAKELGRSAGDEIQRDVALAVYFAAIASALVHHNVKISRHANDTLEESFGRLGTHDWVSLGLAQLFKKARRHCARKSP